MLPELAYKAKISPAARLLLCRLWDYAQPTTHPGVFYGYVYKLQLQTDLDMRRGSIDRSIRELTGTMWLISFSQVDGTGQHLFELYNGESGCSNG